MEEIHKGSYPAVFLCIVFLLFLLLLAGVIGQKVAGLNLGTYPKHDIIFQNLGRYPSPKHVNIDWIKRYPFKKATRQEKNLAEAAPQKSMVRRMYQKYQSVMKGWLDEGKNARRLIPGYRYIGNASYILSYWLGKPTGVIQLANGHWTWMQAKWPQRTVTAKAESTVEFKRYLDAVGIPFLYVQAPRKNCRCYQNLPFGISDFTNDNLDAQITVLKENHIDYLDMRELLHKDHKDHYGMYYKADHHWNMDAGLWAAGKIGEKLEAAYKMPVNGVHRKKFEYEEQVYPHAVFGSLGQQVTHILGVSDDFSVLLPTFSTDFTFVVPDLGIDKRGDFRDLFIDYANVARCTEQGGGYVYGSIVYGLRPLEKIINHKNPQGPKVLMVHDSYGNAVAPYLAMECSELDMIDTRKKSGNFTGSVRTYVENMHPDIVIMLVCEMLGDDFRQ